ncbi:MAG: D-alanyl-D-alanine carboxypeptidase [Actinobacteria bacterium]|nr:D-alanyl-D-alanine carboxypeptidase [Actinomycetota bacterium]
MKKPASIILFVKIFTIFIVFTLFLPASVLYADIGIQPEISEVSSIDSSVSSNNGFALYEDEIDIEAQTAILMDYRTGNILWEKQSKASVYPASITKIMTGILAIENIDDLDQIFLIPDSATGVNHSVFRFSKDDSITLLDLLKASLISSHNNATIALGEYISGSVEEFVEFMNAKAVDIGAFSTNFENTNGLDSEYPDHKTTAYDIALIAKYAMENELFREIVGTESDTIILNDESILLENTNKLLKYDFIKGIKTGYTENAGFCLASFSDLDDRELIAVVLNSSFEERENDIIKLIEWAHENIKYSIIVDSNDSIETIILGSDTRVRLNLYPEDDISKMIHTTSNHINIEQNIDNDLLSLPFNKNQSVGSIEVYINGKSIGKTGIISKVAVDEPYIKQNISNVLEKKKIIVLICIFAFYFLIIIFIILRSLLLKKT